MASRPSRSVTGSTAARILKLASRFVPAADRRDWLEAWEAELWQLENKWPADPRSVDHRAPGPLALSLGAISHSLWERKEWTLGVMLQDVRFALRVLARSPGFTLLAMVTMALGIGANTTIFSLTNATLLRGPDGIDSPADLVQIGRDRPDEGFDNLAYPHFRELRDHAEGLAALAAYTPVGMQVGRGADVEVVTGQLVTGDYFGLLGVSARPGRVLGRDDEVSDGAHPVAVLSEAFWTTRFGADESVVGTDVFINGSEYRIVGVAEPGFRGTDVVMSETDVWIPLSMAATALGSQYADYDHPGFSWLWTVGRLTPGASAASLDSEVDALYAASFEVAWGEAPDHTLGVVQGVGLRPDERGAIGQIVLLLSIVVAVVLAVACANLANLLLARGIARGPELSMRAALGAGRTRLVRQLLTESLILAVGGGLGALLLTVWTARLMPLVLPIRLGVSFRPDATVLGYALAVSLLAGILFGIAPALRATRTDLVDSLKDGSLLSGSRGTWMRNGLVVGQLALSFTLLAAAGLMLKSLTAASSADPGFNTRDVMALTLDLDRAGYDATRGAALYSRLLEKAAALPDVEAVGLASNLPFAGWSRQSAFFPEPRPDLEEEFIQLDTSLVSNGFLSTLQIPLLAGSGFTAANASADMPRVVVISESAAQLLWPQETALGQLLPFSEARIPEESARVIGIVADIRARSLRQQPRASIYLPAPQTYSGRMSLYARSARQPEALAQSLRATVADLDPDLGVSTLGTLHDRMALSLQDTLTIGRLASIFGLLAVALAAVGLYGMVSYVASSRAREIGVRMALGANATKVVLLFVRQSLLIAAAGVAVGAALTITAGGLLASMLYGVAANDPMTLAAIGAGMVLLALAASALPAGRAAMADPVRALRQD